MQMYLAGLGMGALITYPHESTRTGGVPPLSNPIGNFVFSRTMPSQIRHSRTGTTTRQMSRLLRHGPNPREHKLNLNLSDGGSIQAHELLNHPTFTRLHVSHIEILAIAREKDIDNKLRIDLEATADGPKIRCFQWHTLPGSRAFGPRNKSHQRYRIHATDASAAGEILRGGMKQIKLRQEFHFADISMMRVKHSTLSPRNAALQLEFG